MPNRKEHTTTFATVLFFVLFFLCIPAQQKGPGQHRHNTQQFELSSVRADLNPMAIGSAQAIIAKPVILPSAIKSCIILQNLPSLNLFAVWHRIATDNSRVKRHIIVLRNARLAFLPAHIVKWRMHHFCLSDDEVPVLS